jgi:alkyl hydroperoxide reductase subunit AhpC
VLKHCETNNVQLLGFSCDTVFALRVWALAMGGIGYPLLSDFHPHGKVAQDLGIYNAQAGCSLRSIIIIDPQGIVRSKRMFPSSLPIPDELIAEIGQLQAA